MTDDWCTGNDRKHPTVNLRHGAMNQRLTIVEKRNIVDMIRKNGLTQVAVAKRLGITPKTVRNTLHQCENIKNLSGKSSSIKKCHVRVDQRYKEINDAMHVWFEQMREKHGEIAVVKSVIREKASWLRLSSFSSSRPSVDGIGLGK